MSVWIVEAHRNRGWMPASEPFFTRKEAREQQRWMRFKVPYLPYRIRRYYREEA